MLLLLGFLRQRRSRSLGLYKSHMQRQLLSRHQPGKVILRKKTGAEEEEAEAKEFLLTFFFALVKTRCWWVYFLK